MKLEKLFWGVLFLLGGIFLIGNQLGYLPDVNIISLVLAIFLLALSIKSLIKLNFAGFLFPIAFIFIIYHEQFGFADVSIWTILLAALLGSIGLSMIFGRRRKHFNVCFNDHETETIDIEDEGNIRFETSFGESIKYINTDKFVQANLKCSFGGMKVYFDNAKMLNDTAVVRLNSSFGGVQLYVPRNWRVEDKVSVSFGGVEVKNRNDDVTTNTLKLVGNVSFSGVEIIYI